jgi:hypothetical protein
MTGPQPIDDLAKHRYDLLVRRIRQFRQQRADLRSLPSFVGDAHPQVLASGGGFSAQVDVALAPYLELAWVHGIATLNSCQGTADARGVYPWPDVEAPGYVHLKDGRQVTDLLVLWGWTGNTHHLRLFVDDELLDGYRPAAFYFPSVAAMEHPRDYQIRGDDGTWTTVQRGRVTPF